jgi:hypothetical protein
MTSIKVVTASSKITLPSPAFVQDLRFVTFELQPAFFGMTEVGSRRDEIGQVFRGSGYEPVFFDHREVFLAYHEQVGVRLVSADEKEAHGRGGDFPSRSLCWAELELDGMRIRAHVAHWLAHLNDSPARLAGHNAMTALAVRQMREPGVDVAVLLGDANEADRPGTREDKLLGNMATQFRAGGVSTIYDEAGRHPSTFGRRPPIDMIAFRSSGPRIDVDRISVHNVRSDHHFVETVLRVSPE